MQNARPHRFDRPGGIDHAKTARLRRGQVEEGLAGARLEPVAGRFHAVCAVPQPGVGGGRIHVEQVGAVGQQPVGRPQAQVPDVGGCQLPATRLVGERRIEVAVGDDHRAAVKRRTNHLGHVLCTIGGEQQRLGARGDIGGRVSGICGSAGNGGAGGDAVQQHAPDRLAQRGAAGLAGHDHFITPRGQVIAQFLDLRGLANAVDALKRNKQSGHALHLNGIRQQGGRPAGEMQRELAVSARPPPFNA